jgi:SAM-dependent methyltransferase
MRDLEYYGRLWTSRKGASPGHSPEIWNERAEEWIAELGSGGLGKASMQERVKLAAEYLLNRGMLTPETTVIDVGCGPGLFVLEFAKHVKRAVGLDYSRTFIEYGRGLSAKRGIDNAEFIEADFETLDLESSGLEGRFDLAFSSLSPSVSDPEKMNKLAKLSRAWCCNISFAHVSESESSSKPGRDGTGFYSLFNILWLQGHYPETYYFDEIRPDSVCRYGSVLWDVRKKDLR